MAGCAPMATQSTPRFPQISRTFIGLREHRSAPLRQCASLRSATFGGSANSSAPLPRLEEQRGERSVRDGGQEKEFRGHVRRVQGVQAERNAEHERGLGDGSRSDIQRWSRARCGASQQGSQPATTSSAAPPARLLVHMPPESEGARSSEACKERKPRWVPPRRLPSATAAKAADPPRLGCTLQ